MRSMISGSPYTTRTILQLFVVAFCLGTAFSVITKLPGTPYNLRELMWHGGNPLNWLMFGLWLCWFGISSGIMIRFARQRPQGLMWIPALATVISMLSFLFLSLSVTPESIHDILGAPLWSQREWLASHSLSVYAYDFITTYPKVADYAELCGRYIGLYAPLPVLVLLAAHFVGTTGFPLLKGARQWLLMATIFLTLWGCKLIVVDWTATSNIVELISQIDILGLPGIVWCYGALGILAFGGVLFWASMTRQISNKAGLFGILLLSPAGYLALTAGLNQAIQKYDSVQFSALEYLLLGHRTGEWSIWASLVGWLGIQLTFALLLGLGILWVLPGNSPTKIITPLEAPAPRSSAIAFAKWMFAIIVLLISYGSLYPFNFSLTNETDSSTRLNALFSLTAPSLGDTVGNILLFIPYGLFGVLGFENANGRKSRKALMLMAGIALAFFLQLGQLTLPTRDPALFDVLLNTFGIFLGAWSANQMWIRRLGLSLDGLSSAGIPSSLAAAWVLSQLLPLIPTLDLSVILATLKPLILHPVWSLPDTAAYFVSWLAALYLLKPAFDRYTVLFPAIPVVTLALQPFLIGCELSVGEVTGSLGASAVWLAAGKNLKSSMLGIALLGTTLASNLLPWTSAFELQNFHWLPFSGFLEGDMSRNLASLMKKLFQFGGALWLLREGGVSWSRGTSILVTTTTVQEFLQTMTNAGTPEITDPFLALAIGITLANTGKNLRKTMDTRTVPNPPKTSTETQLASSSDHLMGLDGLRAIAALSVFGVHFNQMIGLDATAGPFELKRWLANGNTGVALFFVLSGFLLSLPFWKHAFAQGSKVDIKEYFLRRLARILPAYYLCLGGLLTIMAFRGSAPSLNNVLSHLLFLHNINDWHILSLNSPFWTLAVEMQFYLILPAIMYFLGRLSFKGALLAVSILAISTYAANYGLISFLNDRNHWPIQVTVIWPFSLYISGPDSFVLTYSTLAHLSYFLIGMATASIYVWRSLRRPAIDQRTTASDIVFFASAGTIFMILSTPLDNILEAPTGHYNWPTVPLLLASMILVTPSTRFARKLLGAWPLRWMGVISYGIYIFHYPIQKTLFRVLEQIGLSPTTYWGLFAVGSLAITAIVAALSYTLLEHPVVRWAQGRSNALLTRRPKQTTPYTSKDHEYAANSVAETPLGKETWGKIWVTLGKKQLRKLDRISATQAVSISGAVRHVLGACITDQCASLTVADSSKVEDFKADSGSLEKYEVNLRQSQREFLIELSKHMKLPLDEVLRLIIDCYHQDD